MAETTNALKERIAKIISMASDGAVTTEDVLEAQSHLATLGLASLTQLRVVDAIETELGATLDLEREDLTYLDSLDGLIMFLKEQGIERA